MSSLLLSKAFINGKWVDAADCDMFDVCNPANGKLIGCVPNMKIEDCRDAIVAAKCAFFSKEWSCLVAKQRADLLRCWAILMKHNVDDIADIITAESGKPITEAKHEILHGSSLLEWFAEEARRVFGEIIPSPKKDSELLVIKQPLGVAGLITPWNFPLSTITQNAGAALAAGCTVVIKPSLFTPLTCLAVAKLSEEAGFPRGVINVVTSNNARCIGEYMCKSRDIQIISFTGSTNIGKLIYRLCADDLKRVSLELGGNAPFIIFDSADIKKATESALLAKFRNCGQTCIAANRFFVQDGIYDRFVACFKQQVEDLVIGFGCAEETQMGPLINEDQFTTICELVEDARKKNACILTGGCGLPCLGKLFYAPTIITKVPPEARIYCEEIFGPIAPIIKFKTEEEAIRKANDTKTGLAAYFFTENLQQAFRVAKRLEVGVIGLNEGLISTAEAPFGGIKDSGVGNEIGRINEYINIKYICLGNLK